MSHWSCIRVDYELKYGGWKTQNITVEKKVTLLEKL